MCSQPQKSKIKAEKAQNYGIFQQNMCVQLAVQSVSQRNKTPLWAMEISPSLGLVPPPARPALDTVWWGERKGRWVTMGRLFDSIPMTE